MVETWMLINFILWLAVTVPLVIADGLFVKRMRERYPEAWEDLGKPGFLVDPKTSHKIRGFLRRGGEHPMMTDPEVRRLAALVTTLAPLQTLLFVTFGILFAWLILS